MLINAAAKKWGVEPSECTTNEGVIRNAKGETLGYGDVVKEAAAMEVPETATLKEIKDFKIIGTDVPNVDIDKIISGKPLYGIDYKTEGMVYAAVLRPPAFGKKLKSFDATEARKMPGVIDVVSFGEKVRTLLTKNTRSAGMLSGSDKVAVIANSTWEAMKAKEAIIASWEDDTPMESTEDHDKMLTALLNGKSFKTLRKDGNVKKAFANADTILEYYR